MPSRDDAARVFMAATVLAAHSASSVLAAKASPGRRPERREHGVVAGERARQLVDAERITL